MGAPLCRFFWMSIGRGAHRAVERESLANPSRNGSSGLGFAPASVPRVGVIARDSGLMMIPIWSRQPSSGPSESIFPQATAPLELALVEVRVASADSFPSGRRCGFPIAPDQPHAGRASASRRPGRSTPSTRPALHLNGRRRQSGIQQRLARAEC